MLSFSDSNCVGCRKLEYHAYVIKIVDVKTNHRSPPLKVPLRRRVCLFYHAQTFGCTNHNFMHEKKLSFFTFPNKLKQSQRWGKCVQAVKRVNSDGSKWEPHGNYVYLCSDHFKVLLLLELPNPWFDL